MTIGDSRYLSAIQLREQLAWSAPWLEFSGTPLREAVPVLNRYAAVPLVIGDPAIANLRISGYLRGGNERAFLRLLEAQFGVAADHTADSIILHR